MFGGMLENHHGVRTDHSTLSQQWQQRVRTVITVRRVGKDDIERQPFTLGSPEKSQRIAGVHVGIVQETALIEILSEKFKRCRVRFHEDDPLSPATQRFNADRPGPGKEVKDGGPPNAVSENRKQSLFDAT